METITITIIKWTILIVITAIWYYVADRNCKRPGMLASLDAILPTFWYMVFVIIWLIVFFIIF